jgi:hypothetical protein
LPCSAQASLEVFGQAIQILVKRLLDLGVVETQENPARRRSPRIGLPAEGRGRFRGMVKRGRVAGLGERAADSAAVANNAETLRKLRLRSKYSADRCRPLSAL